MYPFVIGWILSEIEGGNFKTGFYASGVSSLMSTGVRLLRINAGDFSIFSDKDVQNALTIAAGGLSGGLSATIAGGNFWRGARQGIIASGLNHIASSLVEKRTDYANDGKGKKKGSNTVDTGDVLNWFDEETDMGLWNYAEQSSEKKGVLEIHAHGSKNTLGGFKSISKLNDALYKSSPAWKSFRDDGKSLTLKLYSCNTGKSGGIAQTLSRYYKNLTVIAPTNRWVVNYIINSTTGSFIRINRVL